MLLLTLILHLVLWLPVRLAFAAIPALAAVPFALELAASLFAAGLLARFTAFLVDVYAPALKPGLRALLRLSGVRWLALLAAAATCTLLVAAGARAEAAPTATALGLLLPLIVISTLHALGFEISLRRLDDEPEPGRVLLPERPPPPAPKEELVRSFRFEYRDVEHSFTLVIRRGIYDELRARRRVLDPPRWPEVYVAEGITGEVRELALWLLRCGLPFGTYDEVGLVLAFVQQVIRYEKDEGEYPKYPVETLAEGKGDCEDYAILAAAILAAMGYETALLYVPGHAALAIAGAEGVPGVFAEKDDLRYYYCEMTGTNWAVGELPAKYSPSDIEVHPVPPLPARVLEVAGSGRERAQP